MGNRHRHLDPHQPVHYGNFTLYLKSVVYKQQNVLLAEDIFAMGYVGGDDCNFFRTADDYRAYMSNYNPNKSLFACLVPYSTADFPNPMDITGRLPNDKVAANPTDNSLHYPSAPYYSRYWSFDNTGYTDGNSPHYTSSMGRINTICYQGHQAMYNMADSNYSLVVKNTGMQSFTLLNRACSVRACARKQFPKAICPSHLPQVTGRTACIRDAGKYEMASIRPWSPFRITTCTAEEVLHLTQAWVIRVLADRAAVSVHACRTYQRTNIYHESKTNIYRIHDSPPSINRSTHPSLKTPSCHQ